MRWKWILTIAIVVIVALIVTVYAILSSYDFNNLKPKIIQAVKDATGRELTLGGDIELEIGFTPALVVQDVSFQNAPWDSRPDMAKIRRFEVQVALLPLIGGIIEVRRLILVEPDILVATNSSGRSNLEFEIAKKVERAEQKEEAPVKGDATLPGLTFNEVRIERGRLAYKDGRSSHTYVVSLDNLTAVALGKDSPVELELKGAYNGKPFDVAGTLGPLVRLADPNEAWPLKLTAKLGDATVAVHGAMRDVMNAKGLALTVTAEGRSITDIAKLADVAGVPDVGPFKAAVKLADPGGTLTVDKLDLHVGTDELASVKVTGAVKDPLAQRGIKLSFEIRGKDMANLEKLAGHPLPLKGPFHVQGRTVDPAAKTYKISDLNVALGDSDLSGSVQISLAGKQPRLTAALSSQKLDLRPILSKDKQRDDAAGHSPEPAAKQGKVFPDDRLPLDGLNQADVNVKIRAGQVLLPLLAINDLSVDVALEEGHLTVKPLTFVVGAGTVNSSFDLRPQGKVAALALALKIDQLDLGRMLKELGVNDIMEGKLDVDIDLNGRGNSVAALMGGLNGKVILVMGDGRIGNDYIGLLGSDLSSSIFKLFNPFRHKTSYTAINCFVSGFDIKDGLARTTALVFDTNRLTVVGDGRVNLKTEKLDLSLMPSPKEGVGIGGIGKLSLSLGELAKPFKLGGTLTNPSLAIDTTKTVITLGKALGGVTLFGPAGIAAALAGGRAGDKDPCLAAIEAATKGAKVSGGNKPDEKVVLSHPKQ